MRYKKSKITIFIFFLLAFTACMPNKLVLEINKIEESAESNLIVWENQHLESSFEETINSYSIGLVAADLREEDITTYVDLLKESKFNNLTKWPSQMPDNINPEFILENAKTPGLNIKKIHDQNITGKNIGVVIIDGPLLTEHIEYKHSLQLYQLAHQNPETIVNRASDHGAATISILAGKNVGVAPDVDVYYIAERSFRIDLEAETILDSLIEDIEAIIELNEKLPQNKKIRIVGTSYGAIDENLSNYNEWKNIIKKASEENIFILDMETFHDFFDLGLRLKAGYDPNDMNSYVPVSFYKSEEHKDHVALPIQGKVYASATGIEDYTYDGLGGDSWGIPYICGLYALVCQINNNIDFYEFYELLKETSIKYEVKYDDHDFDYQYVVQPLELIQRTKEEFYEKK